MNPTLTHSELIKMVMEREKRGAAFVSLQTVTDPRMVKKHRETGKPNPYLEARKVTVINAILGTSYESCVNRQQIREQSLIEGGPGHFEAQERAWGKHYQGSKTVIEHKGKFYLALRPTGNLPQVEYVMDGAKIAAEVLKDYLPVKNDDSAMVRQNVHRVVRCMDYALDSIQQITIDKETFTIVH